MSVRTTSECQKLYFFHSLSSLPRIAPGFWCQSHRKAFHNSDQNSISCLLLLWLDTKGSSSYAHTHICMHRHTQLYDDLKKQEIKPHVYFAFVALAFGVRSKNSSFRTISRSSSPVFSCRIFMVSCLIFNSLKHFKLFWWMV